MRFIFRDTTGRLRNGWWILLFVFLLLASTFVYTPISRWLQSIGVVGPWLTAFPALMVLLVTWGSARAHGGGLAGVGLRLDGRWLRQGLAGTALGSALILAITGLIAACGGVTFAFDPQRSLSALAGGTLVFLCVAWLEELLFRGFVFQRLLDGIGIWPAQILMAVLFALAHQGNPDMEDATRIWASIDIALGAILLGLAYLRTRSLALPIGIHFGWNWMQGTLLGFDVSGTDQHGWLLPALGDRPEWLTGGAFGPEASAFAVLVDLVAIVWLWRWRGTAERERPGSVSTSPEQTPGSVSISPAGETPALAAAPDNTH